MFYIVRVVYSLVLAVNLVYLPAHSVSKYNKTCMTLYRVYLIKVPISPLPIFRKGYDDIPLSSCLYYHNNQV